MFSDKVSNCKLGRAQKELGGKEKTTVLLRAARYINYDKLLISGDNMEKLLLEIREEMGIKLTGRRIQQLLKYQSTISDIARPCVMPGCTALCYLYI